MHKHPVWSITGSDRNKPSQSTEMGTRGTRCVIQIHTLINFPIGDFYLFWECLQVLLFSYWGSASTPGSLYHLCEVHRQQVDHKGKTYSVADEFAIHCFKAHLANLCRRLKIRTPSDAIPHDVTRSWLQRTAERLLKRSIMPANSEGPHVLAPQIIPVHRFYVPGLDGCDPV